MGALSYTWQVVASGDEGPGPRSRHGLVFDRGNKATILFGGLKGEERVRCCSDTWELRKGSWTRIETSTAPVRRHRGAMVFDPVRGCSILFGGQTNTGMKWLMLNDTWLYEDHRWTKRSGWFWKCPSPRCGHAMAFDEEQGVAVLFGGIDTRGEPLGDTWTFDGSAWRRVKAIAPEARRYAAFAYHPELKGCLLHGGAVDDNGQVKFGDTWLFRDGEWMQWSDDFETEARDDHGLAFHHATGTMVMLEGLLRVDGVPIREVLTLRKSGWREVEVDPMHPRHQCSPMAYDESLCGLVIHGGESHHGGPQFDETLVLRAARRP